MSAGDQGSGLVEVDGPMTVSGAGSRSFTGGEIDTSRRGHLDRLCRRRRWGHLEQPGGQHISRSRAMRPVSPTTRSAPEPTFNNDGDVVIAAGSGGITTFGGTFNNTGSVQVQSGWPHRRRRSDQCRDDRSGKRHSWHPRDHGELRTDCDRHPQHQHRRHVGVRLRPAPDRRRHEPRRHAERQVDQQFRAGLDRQLLRSWFSARARPSSPRSTAWASARSCRSWPAMIRTM